MAPTVPGQTTALLHTTRQDVLLTLVQRLLATGGSIAQVRTAVAQLQNLSTADLDKVTLASDGASFWEATSPEGVADLVEGGSAVTSINLRGLRRSVENRLAVLINSGKFPEG